MGKISTSELREEVISILKTVIDPEIHVDIFELGLIYGIDIKEGGDVYILMTFTSFLCPFADILIQQVELGVEGIDWVKNLEIDITYDPPWTEAMMSEEARLEVGLL